MRLPAAAREPFGGEFSTGEMGNFHPALTYRRCGAEIDGIRIVLSSDPEVARPECYGADIERPLLISTSNRGER
jgi:hypothetical protein